MGITFESHIKERLQGIEQKIQTRTVDYLTEAGERLCDDARASKTYTDRTGRLTASIGYGVVHKGQLVRTGGFGGGEGEQQGMEALREAASQYGADDTALIVVAGMPYAVYVSRKGYNVLDHTRLSIKSLLQ